MISLPDSKKLILYDGHCVLCDYWVRVLLRHDKKEVFYFTELQSETGKSVQKYLGIENQKVESIILYIPKKAYYLKSTAIFEIVKSLPWFFYGILIFKILPHVVTDKMYTIVAKNRYKWFGRKTTCGLIDVSWQHRFI
ncbi:thiol-disulfide oxidoreductase DCC family protein [Flavobacterium sp.]|jgi:predicted DCC family thiol-disulfide oxidoreductase YuxK|uniref:thiol-disulfide oxidoreductase DCC family protein n=2 Tax=Flavobacterium sp. TaxID=239 RepID=UPI0022C0BA5B|nr:DCC1-like thiol-disulfide oxidoreductase family protein [Flavobacterium sp.]MCZ8145467.1 DCC1-like thiol-disulfide oxidoreductase family protein [Flavobacterium sp.]MCZ8366174.1 DCC1-like thiol-disulfide oxidoreductase family protein [Flavobacterium sp.]